MSSITVRQAALSDLDEVAVLFDQYRQFQGRPGDLPAARDFLRARFDHGESVVFMARRPADFSTSAGATSEAALRSV